MEAVKEYTVCCFRDHSFAQKSVNFFSSLKAIDHKTSMASPQQKRGENKRTKKRNMSFEEALRKKRNRSFGGDEDGKRRRSFQHCGDKKHTPRCSWYRDFTGG